MNLSYFGFFALGTFVSGIIIVGLRSVKNDPGAYVKVTSSSVGAIIGGALFPIISFVRNQSAQGGQGLFMYPVGLAVAMLWFFAEDARVNIKNGGTDRLLGLIHFALVIGISLLAAYTLVALSFAPAKSS
jgi:hypothetical protein